jgi:hypothetical protein
MALGVLNAVLPMQAINEKLFYVEDIDETKTYDEAYPEFDTDYARENPATAEEAREKHTKKMEDIEK